MKGHLKNTEIIAYILGKSGGTASAIARHIADCSLCGKKYSDLLALVTPSGAPSIEPGRGVEKRIIATYRGSSPENRASHKNAPLWHWVMNNRLGAVFTAAALMAAIGASLFFGISYLTKRDILPMYVYYFKGSPTIDNKKVYYHMPIRDRSRIQVGKGSVLVLANQKRFIVKIFGQSEMILNTLRSKSHGGGHQFVFNLRKGTIFTRYRQSSHETRYFYFTPNASLATQKSSFVMKVAGNQTIVIPKEGAINIRSFANRSSITASPEKDYVIASSIEISKPSAEPEAKDLRSHLEKPFSDEEIILLGKIIDSFGAE